MTHEAEIPQQAEREGGKPTVWRYAMASRAHLVVDAADYFEVIRDAMCRSQQRIFLIGWDFDTRILLSSGRRWWQMPRKGRFPARLGSFMVWLVKNTPGLDIRVLKWNFSLVKSLFRGTMIFDLIRWQVRKGISFKFDSAHPIGCSHHQKIVVIDDHFAVCGGIDVTSGRWDTPDHLPDDPRRRLPPGGKPYGPWHDVTMVMEGEIACVLGELGRERWVHAGGKRFDVCGPQEGSPWPDDLDAEFENVEIGIARTRAAWSDLDQISEIEDLFVEQIARAKRFIYAETQYFASRRIAEAIVERLMEPEPPEFLIINPVCADGWLEQVAMDSARVRLVDTLQRADHAGRFRIMTPLAADDAAIYVHAKLMIVDDELLRVGSANMNNRSMGLDSECDVFIDAARPANSHIGGAITRIRHRLLAEHCGVSQEQISEALEQHGSMFAAIDALPMKGKRLVPLRLQRLSETERAIADSAVLDPERPGEMFEPIERRGLFRRKGHLLRVRLKERMKRRFSG